MNNNFNFNSNKIMHVNNENVSNENNTVNNPFEVMNKNNNDSEKKLKKYKLYLYICIFVIVILLFYSLIVSFIKNSGKNVEIASKENLENVSSERNNLMLSPFFSTSSPVAFLPFRVIFFFLSIL